MPKEKKTFEEFVATKQQVSNSEMCVYYSENPYEYDKLPCHYFIYDGTWWIQETRDGSFYTLLYIDEYWNDDISEIEEILYHVYCLEVNDG
jgi:hypothetical protein